MSKYDNRIDLGNVRGQKGDTGNEGVGIRDIVPVSRNGLELQYKITYTQNKSPTYFTVKDGANLEITQIVERGNLKPVTSGAVYSALLNKSPLIHTHDTGHIFLIDENGDVLDTLLSDKLDEIDEHIDLLERHEYVQIVQSLPSSNIDDNVLYLVASDTPLTDNIFEEYVHKNNRWEHVGSVNFVISNYYTITQVDNLLANKVDKVNGKGLSTEDYTTAEKQKLSNLTIDSVISSSSTNPVQNKVIKAYIDSQIGNIIEDMLL